MELQMILQNAVVDMEALKDYYFSQIDVVVEDVEEKLQKYYPGKMIDRYLYAKATGQEELLSDEFGKKIKEIAEKLICDISIKEEDSRYAVSYKLNETFTKDSEFELDPSKAAREYRKLSERIEILNNSILMLLLVKYEEFISKIFSYLIYKYPYAYLEDKKLTYSEIMEIDSKVDNIKKVLLEREIEEIMRSPISNWYNLLNEKHSFNFDNIDSVFDEFKEIYYRRNIIVHNNGKVNSAYVKGVNKKYRDGIQQGDILNVDKEYLKRAFELVYIVIYGTILSVSKLKKDNFELHDALQDYAFQHMIDGEWGISLYVYENLKDKKTLTTSSCDLEIRKINYWISLKNMYGIEKIKEEIEDYDVSAMQDRFKVAKACLLNDHVHVSELLERCINTEIYSQNVETWPLFIQYRESSEYEKFKMEHISEFEKQVYDAEEIQHEEIDDEILDEAEMIS